jgi:hypothetical protein
MNKFYLKDLPNIFGKSLCGPDFDVRIEDFGYTFRPPPQKLNDTIISNNNFTTTTSTTSKSTTSKSTTKKPNKEIENLLKSISICIYLTKTTIRLNTLKIIIIDQYCSAFFEQMRSIGGAVIGNLITPLLFGKILYTPKTAVTYNLIQKVSL